MKGIQTTQSLSNSELGLNQDERHKLSHHSQILQEQANKEHSTTMTTLEALYVAGEHSQVLQNLPLAQQTL